jgi:hypothetical protein
MGSLPVADEFFEFLGQQLGTKNSGNLHFGVDFQLVLL